MQLHPGGPVVLSSNSGKDMTSAFFGGVYQHSNAAHNVRSLWVLPICRVTNRTLLQLLAMKRVAILAGGVELIGEDNDIPSAQRLYITKAGKGV